MLAERASVAAPQWLTGRADSPATGTVAACLMPEPSASAPAKRRCLAANAPGVAAPAYRQPTKITLARAAIGKRNDAAYPILQDERQRQ